jgi:hypothetical protein
MNGWNDEAKCFSPRHEASTIELFFDLWFVGTSSQSSSNPTSSDHDSANLALFTQYHAITNRYTFWSYVAFFIVIWSSWFHIVCFDARFTSDSVWERACKVVQFCSFAAFALAGYKFMPVAKDVQSATPHWVRQHIVAPLRHELTMPGLSRTMLCTPVESRMLGITIPRYSD